MKKLWTIARFLLPFVLVYGAFRFFDSPSRGAERRYTEAISKLSSKSTGIDRWYALGDSAKEAFHTGRFDEARAFADELSRLTPQFTTNWNYGNAIQDANIVYGLLALRSGDREKAKMHLKLAGDSPGSPQMNSFGPNMCLARALIQAGESSAVLSYFEQCRRFWGSHGNTLDRWRLLVSWGITPDFGANLIH